MERRGLTTKVRRIPNTATNSYNCHGFVYLDATVWLNDPTPVIRDNKYFVPQKPEVGDAVVYTDTTPTLDKDRRPSFAEIPPHSGLVTKGSPGNPTEVTSKWGSWHVYQHRPADVWTGYGRPTFLRSARAGGHTAEGIVPYDIKVSFSGRPGANAILRQFVAPRAFTLPAGLIPSQGRAGTAPAARVDLDIRKNGASIGTISFAASSNAATFTFAREVTFAPGDRLAVIAPGSQDASLTEISITLQGTRSYR